MRLVPKTAAYRIAILSAVCFGVAVLIIGLAVFYAVHSAFEQQIDASIQEATVSLVGDYSDDGLGGLAEAIAIREESSGSVLGFAVFDANGRRIAGKLNTARPAAGWSRIQFRDPVEGADPARALATNLRDRSRLVVAADLEPVEQMDDRILAYFGIGFLAVLILGACFAVALGRYLQARLGAIAKGSRGFATGELGERADVGPRGDEFDQLAISLNAMLDRIDALLCNLRQVTSDLAHDMRTPLTHLRNQLETLRESPAPDHAALTDAAIERCDDILRLFAAMLRISELEGGALERHFGTVDLGALAREVGEAHVPEAEESGHLLTMTITEGPLVRGDRELLAQAAINLIENALRHTATGSAVQIEAFELNGQAVLQVRDDGPGIAAADRTRATERFVRLDAARSTAGHGLGLSVVKAISEAHGARLELHGADPGLDARIVFERGQEP